MPFREITSALPPRRSVHRENWPIYRICSVRPRPDTAVLTLRRRLRWVDVPRYFFVGLDRTYFNFCGLPITELRVSLRDGNRVREIISTNVIVARIHVTAGAVGLLDPANSGPRNDPSFVSQRLRGDQLALPLEILDVGFAGL